MILLTASTSSLLGATTSALAAFPPALHERGGSAPSLGSSPGGSSLSRSPGLTVVASALCPPRSGTRAASSSGTRFAPALSRARTGKRRRRSGTGPGGPGDVWGDDDFDVFRSGPWDGFDGLDAGSGGGGSGRFFGGGGSRGGGGGGGGWHGDRSNSEFGDWPALAGAAWLWQAFAVASLAHSLFFVMFPSKAAAPAAMPQPCVDGL